MSRHSRPVSGDGHCWLICDLCEVLGAFKLSGILIFFSGMEADRNVKVVGGDVTVL